MEKKMENEMETGTSHFHLEADGIKHRPPQAQFADETDMPVTQITPVPWTYGNGVL